MSNVFQQIIDNVKQVVGDSGLFDNLLVSSDAQQQLNEGLTAHHDGDYAEAIRIYSDILKRHPQYEPARHSRSIAYIILGNYDFALADAEYLIHHNPLNINHVLLRGEVYKNMGHYQSAMDDFTRVIDSPRYGNKWRAYYLRASASRYANKLSQAIHDYTYLIVLNEKPEELYDLYSRRGNVYEVLGDDDSALRDFLECTHQRHDYAYGYVGCANIYVRMKEFDKALEYSARAIELDPDNIEYLLQRSYILMRVGQKQEAIAIGVKILDSNPNNYMVHNHLAFYYPHIDELDKAMHHITIAIERSKPTGAFFDTRAQIHWLSGDYKKALQDFETANKIEPAGIYVLGQAITHFTMDNKNRALELWQEAIELDTKLKDIDRIKHDYQYSTRYVQVCHELVQLAEGKNKIG